MTVEGLTSWNGPLDVKSVSGAWPRGPILNDDGKPSGRMRDKSLVRIYTDPGGFRVVAAADIWGKDPGKSNNQW